MKPKKPFHTRTLSLVSAVILSGFSHAATAIWTSTGSGGQSWSDGANWSGGIAPSNGDDIEIGIPVSGGARITNNDGHLSSVGNLWLKANLNEVTGSALTLNGNLVRFTAGGTSIGYIRAGLTMTQDTTFDVSANTSNGRLEITSNISGAFDMIKDTGTGRLRFTGTAKTYTGDTVVRTGILDLSADNMLPFGTGNGDVFVATGGQLLLNNVNSQINGLNGSGAVNKGGSNTRNLTLGNNNATGDFAGNMSFSGGSSTINKVGSGTQVLSGNITTAGAGTISGGTLQIDGSWSNGISVANGATLAGDGTIGGTATIQSGGTIAPGASIGTLGVAAATLNGTLLVEYSGATIDLLNVTGALDITNATVDFDMIGSALSEPSYVFATYGSLTGTQFATVSNLPVNYEIDYAFGGNNIALVLIPEPSAALLGGLGLLALLRRRR